MCKVGHQNRRRSLDRSSQRINPVEQPRLGSCAPSKYAHKEHRRQKSTASTSISGSSTSCTNSRKSSTTTSNTINHQGQEAASRTRNVNIRDQEIQKKICPITGILRNISFDYHIFTTVLGKGQYGCVREAQHRRTLRLYAVKSVDKSKIRRLDHLRREVHLLHKMDSHDSIMKMVDCYEDVRYVHIVTEKYAGGELFDKISESTTLDGCFSEKKAARIIKSLLEAVAYLHENDIVHRDLKPENILFESNDEDAAIKLIDFGLSRRYRKGDPLMSNPVGTAYYMAPELLEGKYDESCDVWSLGTIAYIMLCGYPPFNGDTDLDIFEAIKKGHYEFPTAVWKSISEEAKDFLSCLMRMDPRRRPSAKEALNHPWIRKQCGYSNCSNRNGNSNVVAGDANQPEDLVIKIQSLRQTISKLKKSLQMSNNRDRSR